MRANLLGFFRGAAIAAALIAPQPAARAAEKPTQELVRSKIAALEVDAADGVMAKLKALAKTPEDRAAIAKLDKELADARKIENVAKGQIPRLLKQSQPREAWILTLQTVDQFPGAIAVPALLRSGRPARDMAFFAVDDFDRCLLPMKQPQEGSALGEAPKEVGHLFVAESTVEVREDGMGGRALRWTWGASAVARLDWPLRSTLNLADFEYLTLRTRAEKAPGKPLAVRFYNDRGNEADIGAADLAVKATGGGWRELRVPLASIAKKGAFDAGKVAAIGLVSGPGPAEVFLDEVLLAKKAK